MRTTHRNYSDEQGDFNLLCQFIVDNNSHLRQHSTWCLGRFVDWKYALWGSKLSIPGFWEQNAHLWFDGFGKLAGFTISENGGGEIAIITAAGYRLLFTELLLWVIENWCEREPALSIEITAHQLLEAEILESHGFQRGASFFTAEFDLTMQLVDRYPLQAGFNIVAMKSPSDYRRQLLLRQNAFAGKTHLSDEEEERTMKITKHALTNPIYHADTDLCVVAPDGTFVSGCEALIDSQNLEADIERVCTHSDYRRQGLARVVIQECLYRLQAIGMQKAYITGYSEAAIELYGSLGAGEWRENFIYNHKG